MQRENRYRPERDWEREDRGWQEQGYGSPHDQGFSGRSESPRGRRGEYDERGPGERWEGGSQRRRYYAGREAYEEPYRSRGRFGGEDSRYYDETMYGRRPDDMWDDRFNWSGSGWRRAGEGGYESNRPGFSRDYDYDDEHDYRRPPEQDYRRESRYREFERERARRQSAGNDYGRRGPESRGGGGERERRGLEECYGGQERYGRPEGRYEEERYRDERGGYGARKQSSSRQGSRGGESPRGYSRGGNDRASYEAWLREHRDLPRETEGERQLEGLQEEYRERRGERRGSSGSMRRGEERGSYEEWLEEHRDLPPETEGERQLEGLQEEYRERRPQRGQSRSRHRQDEEASYEEWLEEHRDLPPETEGERQLEGLQDEYRERRQFRERQPRSQRNMDNGAGKSEEETRSRAGAGPERQGRSTGMRGVGPKQSSSRRGKVSSR